MVMYFGEAVEYGTRDAVFSDPQHDYTRTLFAATPRADVESGTYDLAAGCIGAGFDKFVDEGSLLGRQAEGAFFGGWHVISRGRYDTIIPPSKSHLKSYLAAAECHQPGISTGN
jgi:hypothetical protein